MSRHEVKSAGTEKTSLYRVKLPFLIDSIICRPSAATSAWTAREREGHTDAANGHTERMGLNFEAGSAAPTGGRAGTLHLPHGTVHTPVFMPVGTAATVKTVPQSTLEEIGASGT